jgi:CRP-like cAMP-binding protein
MPVTPHILTHGSAEISSPARAVEARPRRHRGELPRRAGPTACHRQARQDCEFVAVDARSFQDIVRDNPAFALEVMRSLARRLATPQG